METGLSTKKGITSVALRYSFMGVIVLAVQLVIAYVVRNLFPENILKDYSSYFNFALIIVSVDIVGFPAIYFLCKKLPAWKEDTNKMGVKNFLLGICFCYTILLFGSIIGSMLNIIFNYLGTGTFTSNSAIAEIMMDSDPFMRALTVGILAPIFEELIFRKVLIDHFSKYGKVIAIVASGVMFGLFHGNFAQFFYAAGLGLFFGYVYVKTGNILYTICYHMIINLSSSVIALRLSTDYLNALDNISKANGNIAPQNLIKMYVAMIPLLLYYLYMLVLAIIGAVTFSKRKHSNAIQVNEHDYAPDRNESIKAVLTNPGMIVFYAYTLILFLNSYVEIFK